MENKFPKFNNPSSSNEESNFDNEIGDGVVCPLSHNAFSKETSFNNFNYHLRKCRKEFLVIDGIKWWKKIYEELFKRIINYQKKQKQIQKQKIHNLLKLNYFN